MSTDTGGQRPARRGLVIAAFAAVYLIWGSTYLGIRFAVETLPPFLMGGARFLTAGMILYTTELCAPAALLAALVFVREGQPPAAASINSNAQYDQA